MGSIVYTDATVWIGGLDIGTASNKLALTAEVETKDATTFGSGGWRVPKGGLRTASMDLDGFADWAATQDSTMWTNFAASGLVTTVTPTGADLAPAYIFTPTESALTPLDGQIGELGAFHAHLSGTDGAGLIRGNLLLPKQTRTATGTANGLQIGTVGASQFLYATFHVFTAGTTITAVVESDDNSGFTSAITRITFGPITTIGGTWAARVAGPITDNWWRIRFTTVTGTFVVAAAVGIA